MSLISVADRTGSALAWLGPLADEHQLASVDKPTEIGLAGPEGDVLVLGPREVSATGLRRVATWKSTRTGAVVALTDDVAALQSADVLGVVDATVDVTGPDAGSLLLQAVRSLTEQPAAVVTAPTVDMDSAMARLRRGRAAPPVVRPVTVRSHPVAPSALVRPSAPVEVDDDAALVDETADDAGLAWDEEGGYDEEPTSDGSGDVAPEQDGFDEDAYDEDAYDEDDAYEDEDEVEVVPEEVDDDADETAPADDEVDDDEPTDDPEPAPPAQTPSQRLGLRPRPRAAAPAEADVLEPVEEVPAEPVAEAPVAEPPAPPAAELPPPPPPPETPVQTGPGQVITVAAASGGCGKTLYSTNLSAFLSGKGLRVLLIDLDLQFGEVAMALRLRHPYSIYDGLYDPQANPLPDTAFTEHVAELVVHSELGFDVLCAPRDPRFADAITSEDAAFVIEVTRLLYDVVIIDTPPSLAPVALAALDRSSAIAVLVTLDVPSLRNLASYLDVLSDRGVDEQLVKLLVNKVEPDIGLDVKGAQEAFGGRFQAELPADRSASRSVNKGVVVVRAEPKSSLARAIQGSFSVVLPPGLSHLASAPKKKGFLSFFKKN